MTKIIVSLQKGATLKVFVTGERVTPTKERLMDSSDELVVEKENFKCEFLFRENLEIKLPVGVELDTRLFPKTWEFMEVEDMDGDERICVFQGGELVYKYQPDYFHNIIQAIKTGNHADTIEISQSTRGKNSTAKTAKTPGKFSKDDETSSTLSTVGKEDFEACMKHKKQKILLPKNYKTKGQQVFERVCLEPRTVKDTVKDRSLSIKIDLTQVLRSQRSNDRVRECTVFKQKRVNIVRGNFLYD